MLSQDYRLAGLNSPLRVSEPDRVMPLLAPVFANWPYQPVSASATPFATIGPAQNGALWRLQAPLAMRPEVLHDPVNAICDLIVETSWERLRTRPELLCLHAAAIAFGDRLVIFPNQRRAGKSLLSAALARLGCRVFSDDFVPLAVNADDGAISGLANGIAPRLRMPLPDGISADLAAWIAANVTTRNKQYGYLTEPEFPTAGLEMPVGAIVMLDRDMGHHGPAKLVNVGADEALSALVLQNFGRQVHAGAILAVTEAMVKTVPVMRLTYQNVEEAAALLAGSAVLSGLPTARVARRNATSPTRPAPLDLMGEVTLSEAGLHHTYMRVAGYTAVQTGDAVYIASAFGLAIHRLNPVSALIWHLLETPQDGQTVVAVLGEVFESVAQEQLVKDVGAALTFMLNDGLLAQK